MCGLRRKDAVDKCTSASGNGLAGHVGADYRSVNCLAAIFILAVSAGVVRTRVADAEEPKSRINPRG